MTNYNNPEDLFDTIISEPISRFTPLSVHDLRSGDFRQLLNKEISSGTLDPTQVSSFGKEYQIVNLSKDYREIKIPYKNKQIYVSNLPEEIKILLNNVSLEVATRNLAEIKNHVSNIENHLNNREKEFEKRHTKVKRSITNIENMEKRFDPEIENILENIYIESRRESIKGLIDIKRDVEHSVNLLHRCEFNQALKVLDKNIRCADVIIVNIEFIKAIMGTIDHNGGEIPIPDEICTDMLQDIVYIITSNKNVEISIEKDSLEIVCEEEETTEKRTIGSQNSINNSDIADEMIFLFRELEGSKNKNYLETQTGELPETVCKANVFDEFESFCTRQTDIVSNVNVQENAPPGFITIEFIDDMDSALGVDKLQKRATEEYE